MASLSSWLIHPLLHRLRQTLFLIRIDAVGRCLLPPHSDSMTTRSLPVCDFMSLINHFGQTSSVELARAPQKMHGCLIGG